MESSYVQQGWDGRYGAQMDLMGFFYLPDVFIRRALHIASTSSSSAAPCGPECFVLVGGT